VNILQRIRRYSEDADPLVAGCNWIALLLVSNHPIYPLYLFWMVGGDWWTACWTFLATPFFLAVSAIARRHSLLGRATLPAIGIANCAMNIPTAP
jgi:protein-S-isoprenylcysteine O-methyltransferase Ste14